MGANGARPDDAAEPVLRVLVIDDDVVVAMTLQLALAGIEVLEASRGSIGEALARDGDLAAIVVDLRLPDGDGLDVVRRLRRAPATRQTPIVVLTAAHDPGQEAEVLHAGADEYLAKPYDPATLEALLRALVAMPGSALRERRQARLRGEEVPLPVDVPQPEPEPARRRHLFRRRR